MENEELVLPAGGTDRHHVITPGHEPLHGLRIGPVIGSWDILQEGSKVQERIQIIGLGRLNQRVNAGTGPGSLGRTRK